MFPPEGGGFHPAVVTQTMFVDRVGLATAERMLARLEASDAPMRVVQVRVLGGAVARVPADATAYAHRARRMMLNIAAFHDVAEHRRALQAWVDDVAVASPDRRQNAVTTRPTYSDATNTIPADTGMVRR